VSQTTRGHTSFGWGERGRGPLNPKGEVREKERR
jgi:hypothetical protein